MQQKYVVSDTTQKIMHVSRLMDIIEDKYTYLQDTDKMDCKMVWIAIYCYIVDIFCTGMYDKLDKKTVTDIYSTNEEYVQRIKWNKIEKKSYQYAYDIKSWMKNVNPDVPVFWFLYTDYTLHRDLNPDPDFCII